IPIAEDTGIIVDITYQVLQKTCRFINRISEVNPNFEGVHVNFSGHMFSQIDLADRVEGIITSSGTPFNKIKIEITESILLENTKCVSEFAERMQKKGVRMELDDFGTGYSNIVSVMTMPLDTVKLDKSLIWAAMNSKKSAMMVRSITRIST
ncbi:EAL domain-containing protein, partial [Intestinibacillus massiliensis]|nr:EAL domain-containing protein [Intestinibacillus massiliensis]